MSKLGKRLIGAMKEAVAIARGELEPARVHVWGKPQPNRFIGTGTGTDADARMAHHIDCEYWHDQYSWECSCGLTERMTAKEYFARRYGHVKDLDE
jgi:hypothetical protein